jgi:predicted  nucleic acid-binding Zn-ribbon protein
VVCLSLVLTLGFLAAVQAFSQTTEPLHAQIDRLLDEAHPDGKSVPATDAEFMRRVSLALSGMIPTAAQARAFLADTAPDKRARLIDQLLASPEYVRWMTVRLDVMLMERRGEKHGKASDWRSYLEESVAANKPWDQIVREMLSYDGADEKTRGMGRWLLEREGDPNALTRDVARILLGRDLSCAQCHDHPRIADYLQRDYYGLQAFFSRTSLFQPDEGKPGHLAEKPDGEVTFTSVFTKVGGTTRPRLFAEAELSDPVIPPAEQWIVPPDPKDKNKRPVPKFSRRAQLGTVLGDGHHPAFRRNIANRLWAFTFGRGLVEPLDLHHAGNPPTDPALMDLLTEGIAALKFDMKAFLRELTLTRTFQQSMELPVPAPEIAQRVTERIPQLEEQAKALSQTASQADEGFDTARRAMLQAQREAEPVASEWKKQEAALAETRKAADAAAAEMKKVEESLASKRDIQKILAEALVKANEALSKAPEIAELAAAAKVFQTKAEQRANEIPAVEKDMETKKSDVDAKTQAFTAAQTATNAAREKVEEVHRGVSALHSEVDSAAARKRAEQARARTAARKIAESKAFLEWASIAKADQSAKETAAKAESVFAKAQEETQRLMAEASDLTAKLTAMEQSAGTANAQMKPAQDALAARRVIANALAEAAAKAAEVVAKIPNDAELQAASTGVKTKSDAVAAEVSALEKQSTEAQQRVESATKALAEARAAAEKIAKDLAEAQQRIPALESELKAARAKVAETEAPAAKAREALLTVWSDSFASIALSPLMPEQLCWSVMQATGFFEPQLAQAATEWDQKNPLSDADKANPAKQAERAAAIQKAFRDKLRAHEDQYVRVFGGAAGQPQTEFFATPEQALYFENGGVLRGWTSTLAGRLAALKEPRAIAEELYLTTLTRFPDDSEARDVAATIASQPPEKVNATLSDLAWALITSNEFRFSH